MRKYENPKRVRNEGLDLVVGNLAAYRLFNHNLETLADELKFAAANATGAKTQHSQPTHQTGQGKRNWATGGLKW